jgi:geranylgeranyl diphosphate synthase type II
MRHAVFPGGARVRPRLCVAVAQACGAADLALAITVAASIELLHCASLVHDDMPCFDNADIRRGCPSVHKAFGESLALLAGDGLIILAFKALAGAGALAPRSLAPLLSIICEAVGPVGGLVAGQAWECEPALSLAAYHRAKTGVLFAAATMSGALAAGRDPANWRTVGERLGEAFQVADDIRDVIGHAAKLGKPTGRDAALGRPNAVAQHTLAGAIACWKRLVTEATEVVPHCAGAASLRSLIAAEAHRLLPAKLTRQAARRAA